MPNANYAKKGDWNVICDRCGYKYKASQCQWEYRFGKKTFFVCNKCYEEQNPMDFLKSVPDPQKVPIVRPRPEPIFIED